MLYFYIFKKEITEFNVSFSILIKIRITDSGNKMETSGQSSPIQVIRNEQQIPRIIKVFLDVLCIGALVISAALCRYEVWT